VIHRGGFAEFASLSLILRREPYDNGQPDDERQRDEGRGCGGDQGDEQDSVDDAHPGACSGWPGLPRHVVRDDGLGYGNGERRGKTTALNRPLISASVVSGTHSRAHQC
jgi:hypothetical protein